MMIKRKLENSILEIAGEYPVILVQGPRQSGKTTLCRMLFPDKKYISLEEIDERQRAQEDPRGFLAAIPDGAILDEVQRVPDLLSYIQRIVDEKKINGMFILTGSCNLLMMEAVTQTLAGRVAIFRLLPLSWEEASGVQEGWNMNQKILTGFYPRLLCERMNRDVFYSNYISTYVERDVRNVLNIRNEDSFRRLLSALAERTGSVLDVTDISSVCGVSVKTVSEWISVLESSFICFRLHPYYVNRTKRLVKRPKIYFYDTGIACHLLRIKDEEELANDRLRGNLFENMVVAEYLKQLYNSNKNENLFYYRTSEGTEVDLVLSRGRKLYPIEIKASSTFDPSFVKGITKFASEYEDICGEKSVIYTGTEEFEFKGVLIKPVDKTLCTV